MRKLVMLLDRLRGSEIPVLIQGETGSGKELVARVLHEESPRADHPFRVIDCATIPGGLLETELFGALRGAFTDLAADRQGIFAAAAGGTVLLDDIAGTTLELQAKLLRVLAEERVRPVGSDEEVELDLRFIFSSPRDLDAELREGKIRADLYHRIRGVVIDVPPLRQRPEDLPDLVRAILAEGPGPSPRIGEGLIDRLREMTWPGNVRELRNLLLRLRLECTGVITVDALESAAREGGTRTIFASNLLAGEDLDALKGRLERDYLVYHLRRLGGSTDALCRFLGIRKRQLYRRCARLGIPLRRGPGNSGSG
jgi:DNA-binding NtrC family response regulator